MQLSDVGINLTATGVCYHEKKESLFTNYSTAVYQTDEVFFSCIKALKVMHTPDRKLGHFRGYKQNIQGI